MTSPSLEPARMHARVNDAALRTNARRRLTDTGRVGWIGVLRGLAVLLAFGGVAMPAVAQDVGAPVEAKFQSQNCPTGITRLRSPSTMLQLVREGGGAKTHFDRAYAMHSGLIGAYGDYRVHLDSEMAVADSIDLQARWWARLLTITGLFDFSKNFLLRRENLEAIVHDGIVAARGTDAGVLLWGVAREVGLEEDKMSFVTLVSMALAAIEEDVENLPPEYGTLVLVLKGLPWSHPDVLEVLAGDAGQVFIGVIISIAASSDVEGSSWLWQESKIFSPAAIVSRITKKVPWLYLGHVAATLVGDSWASAKSRNASAETQQKNAALHFLKYYIGAYGGDRAAFECALGKKSYEKWDLKDAFRKFLHATDYNGMPMLDLFSALRCNNWQGGCFILLDPMLEPGHFLAAYSRLETYMKNNAVFALRRSTDPIKYAMYDDQGVVSSSSLMMGDDLRYIVSIDPYLASSQTYGPGEECVFLPLAPGATTASGFSFESPQVAQTAISTRLVVSSSASDVSFVQNVVMRCRNTDYNLTHALVDKISTPPGYFHFTSPSQYPKLEGKWPRPEGTFSLTLETPPIEEFITGGDGQKLDVRWYPARLSLEEEQSPGEYVRIAEKSIGLGSGVPSGTYQLDVNKTLPMYGADYRKFFIERTGSRNFRLGVWVSDTPFHTEHGYGIEIVQDFTINAADLTFDWEYEPYRLYVEDPLAAGWDVTKGTLTLEGNKPFRFCFGNPYDGSQGPLSTYTLNVVEVRETDVPYAIPQDRYLVASQYDPLLGCGKFTVPSTAEYRLAKIMARKQPPAMGHYPPFTGIAPQFVQVLGEGGPSGVTIPGGVLNDTGITWSGHATNGKATTCDPAHPAGQDCHYGRDALAAAGLLQKVGSSALNNGITNGFDYTKISNSGNELPASAALGSGPNDWACTRDNVTGLIWEVKVNDAAHLRHQSHGYTWYNPASPDGNPGSQGNTSACGNTLGGQLCNTHTYTQAVNAQGLCGHSDWRMPDIVELEGITDKGRVIPAIDPQFFPNTPSSDVWSGSPYANYSGNAWGVNFNVGLAYYYYLRSNYYQVRLVRGGQ